MTEGNNSVYMWTVAESLDIADTLAFVLTGIVDTQSGKGYMAVAIANHSDIVALHIDHLGYYYNLVVIHKNHFAYSDHSH